MEIMANKSLNTKMLALLEALERQLPAGRVCTQALLAPFTTFQIGGPADILVQPESVDELSQALRIVHEFGQAVTVLGGGSNVLIRDGGIRGVVIVLRKLREHLRVEGNILQVSAGYMLKDASELARDHTLTGLEFAIGIPGSLGGAVFMNAGAYEGQMSDVVSRVRAVAKDGTIRDYETNELGFSYRHSIFHDNGEVIAEVFLTLKPGHEEHISAHMADLTERRESKQPLEYASAGSTFKRPPGYYAGTLIEQTGLKGLSVGDAQVSEKHAGFVINRGSASCQDVLGLIREVQKRVKEAHGVDLETEVRLLGEDDRS